MLTPNILHFVVDTKRFEKFDIYSSPFLSCQIHLVTYHFTQDLVENIFKLQKTPNVLWLSLFTFSQTNFCIQYVQT